MRRKFLFAISVFLLSMANADSQNEWDKYAQNPVLDVGSEGSWDCRGVSNPSVLYDGREYKMWYTGFDGKNMRIGYATSKDGVHWEKSVNNPVLDLGEFCSWDSMHVANPTVIFNGNEYKMWYTGCNGRMRIGYATSKDGINWQKSNDNPVLDLGAWGSPDSDIWSPSVVFDGSEYKMWFTAFDGQIKIGYATSPDGIHWSKYDGSPVLKAGFWGSWDDRGVWGPTVLLVGSEYKMWYSGWNGEGVRIGYAESKDGLNWIRTHLEPSLTPGTTSEWDYHYVSNPCVILDGNNYKMWYSGCTYDEIYRIGYATGALRPDISLSEYTHNFENVPVKGSATWQFTIYNEGSADLIIHNITSDEPAFKLDQLQLPMTLSPGASVNVKVEFHRTHKDSSYNGYITIFSNDRDEPEIRIPLWMGAKLKYVRQIPRDFVSFNQDLFFGMKGDLIRYLQVMLTEEGPEVYPKSKIDGVFDECTKKALLNFQKRYKLSENGWVGPETRTKLNEILSAYRQENYDRFSMIYDTVKSAYRRFLPEKFPLELIFAIACQETGLYFNFNNELLEKKENGGKDSIGRGIMQITSSDFVGAGSGITDESSWRCKLLMDKGSCYRYYSNSLKGVEANVKDALYALGVKYDMTGNCKGSKELGITDEEMRWISTVQRYNSYSRLMFSVKSSEAVRQELNRNRLPDAIIQMFGNCPETTDLSGSATVITEQKNAKWRLVDEGSTYKLTDDGDQINVYKIGAPTVYLKNVADKLRRLKNPMLFPVLMPMLMDNKHEELADKLEKVYNNSQSITLGSPAELTVYDSSGIATGFVRHADRFHQLEDIFTLKHFSSEGIPNSIYDSEHKTVIILASSGSYEYEVTGIDNGTYDLDIVHMKDGNMTTFSSVCVPIRVGVVHRYRIDWDAVSQGKPGVEILVDDNGDGTFDRSVHTSKKFVYGEVTMDERDPSL